MRRIFVLSLAALALLGVVAPDALAQPVTPKFTITGLIDNLTSYSRNVSNVDGILNHNDVQWYGRTRGRFDFIGEVGKAKGVLGIELDHAYGQAGTNDSTIVNAGAAATTAVATQFGTDGSFDLNTDSRGIIEIKWLYVEFPVPLIPVPTTMRVGAQPFGAAANFKLATYANGDFPGVNIVSTLTPNVKIVATYIQVEEALVGRSGGFGINNAPGTTQLRGDDFAFILAPEITPVKGLDIKPMYSYFYASGTTSGNARVGRGGIGTGTTFTNADGTWRPNVNENRHTVGIDARWRSGPFSFDPTVLYQFGNRHVIANGLPASFASAGVLPGKQYRAELDAWLVDLRAGFQLGPLLIEGLVVYSTGNSARNTTLNKFRSFQPLDTDTSYLADWGGQLSALGLDYLNAMDEAGARVQFPGVSIGWDKYGRGQLGLKATYAITPALSVMAGVNGHWTAEAVDLNSTAVAGAGLAPTFVGPQRTSHYVGVEPMALVSWRFADGLSWDNAMGYMIAGKVLDAITDPAAGPREAKDVFMFTSRVRFTF